MYKYELIIYWSDDDQRYVVEVPNYRAVWQMEKLMKMQFRTPRKLFLNGSKPQKV